MVMEFLDGGEDLGSALKQSGRLPWERVVDIVGQCCDALQAAHDLEIIHRDVKPANLYRLEQDGHADFIKVLDFGIARLVTPQDSIVTATGVIMGTPDFMAPEQAQGRHVDHRADVYSLGASAYALVTGRPPFTGVNEYEVIHKQLNEDPKPPSVVAPNSEIPAWFDDAVLRAMAKKPEERFQSMREFAEALRRGAAPAYPLSASDSATGGRPEASASASSGAADDDVSVASRASASTPARPRPRARSAMPVPVPVLVLAAVALAGIGALGVWLLRGILAG
jgi:eukaryotic-like serine/threonine-protein kinase